MGAGVEIEAELRKLFVDQHGVVGARQVRETEMSRKVVRHRLTIGRWVAVHPNVYADAAVAPTWHQRCMAATLAAGPNAYVSHRTALQLWGVEDIDETAPIEVTTILERDPRIPGLWVHRSGLLAERDERVHRSIPVTTVERAINELSGRLTIAALGRLTDDAVRSGLTTLGRIVGCSERLRWAPGRSPNAMRDMLATRVAEFGMRESWLEEFVFESLQRYDVPLPRTQVWVELPSGPRRLDKCYTAQKLVLESDGFDSHSSRRAFDDDRARNNELLLAGYRVLHFTSEFDDYEVASTVAAALGLFEPQRAPEGPLRFKQWCEARRAVRRSGRGSGGPRGR